MAGRGRVSELRSAIDKRSGDKKGTDAKKKETDSKKRAAESKKKELDTQKKAVESKQKELQTQKEEVEKQVDELQDQLQSMQSEYDDMVKNMEREGRERTVEQIQRAKEEINAQLERSMEHNFADMQNRYKASQQKVSHQQTDILRMNKIFRDVARHLGTNWRSVFEVLTLELPPQVTDLHLAKIEAQRPFMQAYKSLTTWRELAGNSFDMNKLVDALRKCSLYELADSVLETMHKEGDSLMTLGAVGHGIAPGVPRQSSYDGEGASGDAGAAGNGDAEGAAQRKAAQAASSGVGDLEGPLGNRRLLALARLVGGSWMDLGRQLQVPDDELQEVLQNEGMSYQGAFKILWGWRDRNEDAMHQDNVEVLKEALHKTGREDLIKEAGL